MFEKFHLPKTEFPLGLHKDYPTEYESSEPETEMHALNSYIANASYHIDGIGWTTPNRPLSEYARNNLSYIQSFTYYELNRYFTKRANMESYLLKYTYAGSGELKYKGQTYISNTGDGFLIDCREPHEYRSVGGSWKHVEIHFSGIPAAYIYSQYASGGKHDFHIATETFHAELEKLLSLHESVLPYREIQISYQLDHILMMILLHSDNYMEKIKGIPENLRYLLSYMDRHYMQPLTLDFMAEFANISKYHLCRLFQKYVGFSPNEYIIQLRLTNAKILLDETDLPANKIGVMVGIPDENYFYRLFKNREGISIRDFRNRTFGRS